MTPVPAVLSGVAWAGFLAIAVLAYRALGLGQVWALRFAAALAVLAIITGLQQVAAAPRGTTFIPVLAIAAVICLVWLVRSERGIREFVSGSRPIGPVLGTVVAVALLAPTIVSAALPSIPDPTQAGPGDVAMTIAMRCHLGLERPVGDPHVDAGPEAILSAELVWARSDVLPGGLTGLFDHGDTGDTAAFRVIDPPATPIDGGGAFPAWLLGDGNPIIVDAATGETVGWFGSTSPSQLRLPDTIGSFTVGIDNQRIRGGHTTRIEWSLIPTRDGPPAWPRVEVGYAHLDRFVLIGQVSCGERASATANTHPAPPQDGRFLP